MGIICFINLPNYIQWDQVKDNTKWLSKRSLFYSHEYLSFYNETIKETSVYNLIEKYWISLKFHNKHFSLQFVIMLWISCLHLIFLKGFKTKSKSLETKVAKCFLVVLTALGRQEFPAFLVCHSILESQKIREKKRISEKENRTYSNRMDVPDVHWCLLVRRSSTAIFSETNHVEN